MPTLTEIDNSYVIPFDITNCENGSSLLTRYLGEEWIFKINTDDFFIQSPSRCILGQSFGSYELGLKMLDISIDEVRFYGFDCYFTEYAKVNDLWITYLKGKKHAIRHDMERRVLELQR